MWDLVWVRLLVKRFALKPVMTIVSQHSNSHNCCDTDSAEGISSADSRWRMTAMIDTLSLMVMLECVDQLVSMQCCGVDDEDWHPGSMYCNYQDCLSHSEQHLETLVLEAGDGAGLMHMHVAVLADEAPYLRRPTVIGHWWGVQSLE